MIATIGISQLVNSELDTLQINNPHMYKLKLHVTCLECKKRHTKTKLQLSHHYPK